MRRYKQFRSSPEQVSPLPSVGTVESSQTVVRRKYPQFGRSPGVAAALPFLGAPAGGPTTHGTTGALTGAGAVIAGTAARVAGAVTHETSGVLVGPGSAVIGAALNGAAAEFSKNANLYLGIGSDLSVVLGNPRMPSWNTTGRPSAPLDYVYGFNTDTDAIEVWNGSAWV